MLGWEFPPNISGGLGVACYHMVKALREYADITLVLPYLPSRVKLHNISIIRIGSLKLEKIYTEKEQETIFSKYVKNIGDLHFSPYRSAPE